MLPLLTTSCFLFAKCCSVLIRRGVHLARVDSPTVSNQRARLCEPHFADPALKRFQANVALVVHDQTRTLVEDLSAAGGERLRRVDKQAFEVRLTSK